MEEAIRFAIKATEDKWKQRLEQEQERHQIDLRKAKKVQWCAFCAKKGSFFTPTWTRLTILAHYFCCSNVYYCTTDCQRKHWNMGHYKVCKKVCAK